MKTKHLAILQSVIVATMTLQAPIVHAEPVSPSQLFEKGIYAEETKGDLESAITIYQQLVDAAKVNQSLAAQAQLRLGQCLLKKNRQPEAIAAFEKLIRDFPNEKELIAKAREHLPSELALEAVPWIDGERLQMVLKLPGGLDVGAMELRADLVEVGGKKAWRVGRRMSGGGDMLSSVDVDPEHFRPLASYWKHTLLGTVSAEFKPGEVVMQREGSNDPTTVRADKPVFDNEEVMHMMRRLPLQEGYKTTLSVITTLGGGAILPIGVAVTKKEAITVPAGTFDCFKVALDVGQNFWISDDEHRYLVKFDGGGAEGHLTSIAQRKSGAAIPFRNEALGVTLTAPADWVIHSKNAKKDQTVIYLLDPGADAEQAALYLKTTASLPASARQSPRAFADYIFRDEIEKALKNAKVRPASWKNHNLAGRPGVSCVVDYTEDEKPRVAFLLYAVGPTNCESFVLACAPEDLPKLQPQFDQIIASYRITK
jgi:tetratricopeptide (TPR) repeat protein